MSKIRFVGLDVHAETIAVAVAESGGEVRSLGIIPNQEQSNRRLVRKLGPAEQLQACYEAGPTGYVVYGQLTALGVKCEGIAPPLVPSKAGATLRIGRLERAIGEAMQTAPPRMRTVIEALQALRGIAQIAAATIVAELGEVSRFVAARQLMGYSGMVPKEHSRGPTDLARWYHQDWECASTPCGEGSGLGLPTPTRARWAPAQTSREAE